MLPPWLKQVVPSGPVYSRVVETVKSFNLHTVCEEAKCPNRTDCWARGTLTFQVLGDVCTRSCSFCGEKRGKPPPVDWGEPSRLARAIQVLGIRHVVITAPARDDLSDGGAKIFAETVRAIRERLAEVTVEVLTSDFRGNIDALQVVLDSRPDVFNHNLETVRRLTSRVRSVFTYDQSLRVLQRAAQQNLVTKSGLMVGLGETRNELMETFRDLCSAGVQLLTVGQYLPPSPKHFPLDRYYTPQEFLELREEASSFGFSQVFSGPLIRSSYRAGEMLRG